MLFAIIWAVFIGIAFLIAIIVEQKKDERHREKMLLFLQSAIKQPKFSVSDYYDRTQQQQEELQAEKENQDPYVIILWWGLDGLRLNDDGSFEWIRKNQKPVSISYQPQQSVTRQIDDGIRALNTQIQTGMNRLRYEILIQQMQAAQIQQTQNIINSLQSAPYPQYMSYPSQCCINQYTPDLTWCCCQGNYLRGN